MPERGEKTYVPVYFGLCLAVMNFTQQNSLRESIHPYRPLQAVVASTVVQRTRARPVANQPALATHHAPPLPPSIAWPTAQTLAAEPGRLLSPPLPLYWQPRQNRRPTGPSAHKPPPHLRGPPHLSPVRSLRSAPEPDELCANPSGVIRPRLSVGMPRSPLPRGVAPLSSPSAPREDARA